MKVTYFSWLRLKTGVPSEELVPPGDGCTVADLVHHLATRYPALAEIANARGGMRFTVNRHYVESSHVLSGADDVGLFPPVTGG